MPKCSALSVIRNSSAPRSGRKTSCNAASDKRAYLTNTDFVRSARSPPARDANRAATNVQRFRYYFLRRVREADGAVSRRRCLVREVPKHARRLRDNYHTRRVEVRKDVDAHRYRAALSEQSTTSASPAEDQHDYGRPVGFGAEGTRYRNRTGHRMRQNPKGAEHRRIAMQCCNFALAMA